MAHLKLVSYKTPTPVVLAYSSNLSQKSVETSVSLHVTDTDLGADLFLASVNEKTNEKLVHLTAPPTLGTGYDFRA